MNVRKAYAVATVIVGTVAAAPFVVGQFADQPRPHAIGAPAVTFGQQAPALTSTSLPPNCFTVPAKAWGTPPPVVTTVKGVVYTVRPKAPWWHYSPAILKPMMLEKVCLRAGLPAKVTMIPVPK